MRYLRALSAVVISIALLGLAGPAAGVVIIDADVENDGDWSTFSQLAWESNPIYLTPGVQEGTTAAGMNHSPGPGDSIIRTFTGITLQVGTYTVEFAIGNQNNAPFPPSINIEFTGMTLGMATSATTPTPASGAWELWTIVWDVDALNPNLGNDLSWEFAITTSATTNLRFDGVGALSPNGNGFIVSYVPEPATATGVLMGLLVLGWSARRNRR